MGTHQFLIGGMLLAAAGVALAHDHNSSSGKVLVRLHLNDFSGQLRDLAAQHYDVAGVDLSAGTADVLVSPTEVSRFESLDGVQVVDRDYVATWLAPDQRYHTYDKVVAELRAFHDRYPALTELKVYGKSLENRDLYAIKITSAVIADSSAKPKILFNAMHHAREVMTTEVAMDTIEFLLTKYGQDAKVTGWVNANEIWVAPMVNPDGNNKVWTSDSMWRKNARGGYGVDINRNYPFKWGSCDGSSGSTGAQDYRGPSAGSEPETQALMSLVTTVKPAFDISYHSYSELVLFPYGCEGQRTETREVVERIGGDMAHLLPSDNGNGTYTPGTPWELLYAVDGGDIDWMYATHQVIPYVIELNSSSAGFQPPFSKRQPTVEKARAAWALLLDRLTGSGIRGVITTGALAGMKIQAKNLATDSESLIHGVAADGSFHLVLEPGMYQLTVTGPQGLVHEEKVIVGDQLVRVTVN